MAAVDDGLNDFIMLLSTWYCICDGYLLAGCRRSRSVSVTMLRLSCAVMPSPPAELGLKYSRVSYCVVDGSTEKVYLNARSGDT